MPKPKPKARVTLDHPSGKFQVHVLPARAAELERRGYRPVATKPAPKSAAKE